jgi:glyoxylase-like metal-dependent hydrolase (beta-lactamase superfamily II)
MLAVAPGARAAEPLFDLHPVADDVYAAIARMQYKVNSNAAVVILDDGVLVVDTHSKPSAARALIEQIRTLTDKPVKWAVDTHFHWDHYQGNEAYPGAWPSGVEVISSEVTRESIEHRGLPRVKRQILEMPREIEQLKADLARATDAAEKKRLAEDLRQAEAYLVELKAMQHTLPSLTFDRSLLLHRPSRSVQILWLGKAHTDGDVVVYLPKEKVLITGDLLQGWMPYMGDSYPYDWVKTLDEAMKLDFEIVIGGHGNVLRGKRQFARFKSYFTDLLAWTAEEYARGATMAETENAVLERLRGKYGAALAGDPDSFNALAAAMGEKAAADMFRGAGRGNVQKAWRVVSGGTQ